MVHVPGPASLPWEINDVPHGVVHHHFYKSAVVGDERDFYVYTPPGYDPRRKNAYPVLYLLHGFSDDASGWTAVGRANVILDNLIAQGKAKPMLVVMPLGYGAPEIVAPRTAALRDPDLRKRNYDRFRDALFTEVIPQVEKNYRVRQGPAARAPSPGLSMGGAESLLRRAERARPFRLDRRVQRRAGCSDDYRSHVSRRSTRRRIAELRLLWIACGTEDRLIEPNRKFREWLKSKGMRSLDIETPGMHTWMVWRRNLAAFAPLLFEEKSKVSAE